MNPTFISARIIFIKPISILKDYNISGTCLEPFVLEPFAAYANARSLSQLRPILQSKIFSSKQLLF